MRSAFAGHQRQKANKTSAQAVSAAIPVPLVNTGLQAALERQTHGQILKTDTDVSRARLAKAVAGNKDLMQGPAAPPAATSAYDEFSSLLPQ